MHASFSSGQEKGENLKQEGCLEYGWYFANCLNICSPKLIRIKFQRPLKACIWLFGAGWSGSAQACVSGLETWKLGASSFISTAWGGCSSVQVWCSGAWFGGAQRLLVTVTLLMWCRWWFQPVLRILSCCSTNPGPGRFGLAVGASAGWALGLLRGLVLPSSSARMLSAKSHWVMWSYMCCSSQRLKISAAAEGEEFAGSENNWL